MVVLRIMPLKPASAHEAWRPWHAGSITAAGPVARAGRNKHAAPGNVDPVSAIRLAARRRSEKMERGRLGGIVGVAASEE